MYRLLFRYFTFTVLLSLLISCSLSKPDKQHAGSTPPASAVSQAVTRILYQQYNYWQGTPYRQGGLDTKGVDCSGLVYLIFKDQFNIHLPRTTSDQKQIGRTVFKDNLAAGDLVFFKTGWFTNHVGIYIEKNRFLHASTTHGVRVSSLSKPYWNQSFQTAKRIELH